MGVFFEVVEGLVLYCDEQIGVYVADVTKVFSGKPAFHEDVGNDLLRCFFLMNVHR